jgi:hypothetical protein
MPSRQQLGNARDFGYTPAMPRYSVTGPDDMLYDWLVADSPLEALHKLHAEALPGAVRMVDGELVFSDPADQELCAGA